MGLHDSVFEIRDPNSLALYLFLTVVTSLAGLIAMNLIQDGVYRLPAEMYLPVGIGIGLFLFCILFKREWRRPAFWFATLLIGNSASLQMVNAGRLIHYQNFSSLDELVHRDPISLVLVCVQALAIVIGLVSRRQIIKGWLTNSFRIWQLVTMFVFLVLAGAAVTPSVSIYTRSLLLSAAVQVIGLGNLILLTLSVPSEGLVWLSEKTRLLIGQQSDFRASRIDRFALVAAIWVVLLSGAFSYLVYQAHPHVPDEAQYIFQANYMAAGQLTVTPPLVPEAFGMYMVPYKGERWYGIFPPAWPAILALGTIAGANWIVNPLIGGICVILAYLLFQELYSLRFARIAIALLCCSPWFIFLGMSYMSHMLGLACALGSAVLLLRGIRSKSVFAFLGAGGLAGIQSMIRPLDAVILAILSGSWVLIISVGWGQRLKAGLSLTLGAIVTAATWLPYNMAVTGNALLMPSDAYYSTYFWPRVMSLGFGSDRGFGWGLDALPGHSAVEALINIALNVFSLNTELFGWGFGSLLFVAIALISGPRRRSDLWAIVLIAVFVGGYSLFWYHGGPEFGARYWFICIIPLVALTVRGIEWVSTLVGDKNRANGYLDKRVIFAIGILGIFSLISYMPWRASDKYYRFLEMQPAISQLAKNFNFGKSLVLIRGNEHPDYQSAWIYNPLNFDGESPIYAFDKSSEIREELLRSYADRKVWIVAGPSLSNGEYEIELGPVDAEQLRIDSTK